MKSPTTTTPSLADEFYAQIDDLTPAELDELPQGTIQLDAVGTIIRFNTAEANLAGLDARRVIGKNFFRDIAPCTDVAEFRGRFTEGVENKKLFEKFRYRFAFTNKPHRDVMITLFYSARTSTVWVTVQPM